MSFMFNPYPFDDTNCINKPKISDEAIRSIQSGYKEGLGRICDAVETHFQDNPSASVFLIGLDGYVSAQWEQSIHLLGQELGQRGIAVKGIDVAASYRESASIDAMLSANLPEDREIDPVLLFGKIFKGGFEMLFETKGLESLRAELAEARVCARDCREVWVIYGCGALTEPLRSLYDMKLFYDVTPKETILRIKRGHVKNLGDQRTRPFKRMMRRCYYFDFELTGRLRAELLQNDAVDYYVAADDPENPVFFPLTAFNELCASLVKYPFRTKPVYNEGIWGGHYVSRIRHLPQEMKNCAWVFDLIPLEVSLLVQVGEQLVEIPYFTFVKKEGHALMGEACLRKFGGYFPIRFNYDDTWHSSGNMSIQVHPDREYAIEHFGEHGGQDESYYVVATGHDAKTYLGFSEDQDVEAFYKAVKKSEQDGDPVDYQRFVHAVDTRPGTQVLLPAGTIHASGRNQVVLEIGSLTIGSYTFKMYDYMRQDLDGKPRPIHSVHGINVLQKERKARWVEENLVPEPQIVREGEGWSECIIGEHDLLYFSLRRLQFDRMIEDDTDGFFHVLTLVDGEKVKIVAIDDPEHFYIQNYLDIVVVPACMGKYRIINLGESPVYVHKTRLKDNFIDF